MKILYFLLISSAAIFAAGKEPKNTVVTGCQCLDCPYFQAGQKSGLWIARTEVPTAVSPLAPNSTAAIMQRGERAVALSGELHIVPGEIEVIFPHKNYKVGDKLFIVQEDADAGTWKLWHNGKEDFDDLSKMVSEKQPCKPASATCWAKVNKSLSTVWWVNLQTKDKKSVWTKSIDQFEFDRSSCM